MRTRVKFDGGGDSGPVWVYVDAVAAVWQRKTLTMIALVGCREPVGVVGVAEDVLEALDTAESSAAADLLA